MSERRSVSDAASSGVSVFSSSTKSPSSDPLPRRSASRARRVLRHPQDLAHLFGRHLELFGDLLRLRFAAEPLDELPLDVHDLVQLLDMCTGMRIVRALSAIARVTAWRIHHVAYVENL